VLDLINFLKRVIFWISLFLLHILVAELESFSKNYNKVIFH